MPPPSSSQQSSETPFAPDEECLLRIIEAHFASSSQNAAEEEHGAAAAAASEASNNAAPRLGLPTGGAELRTAETPGGAEQQWNCSVEGGSRLLLSMLWQAGAAAAARDTTVVSNNHRGGPIDPPIDPSGDPNIMQVRLGHDEQLSCHLLPGERGGASCRDNPPQGGGVLRPAAPGEWSDAGPPPPLLAGTTTAALTALLDRLRDAATTTGATPYLEAAAQNHMSHDAGSSRTTDYQELLQHLMRAVNHQDCCDSTGAQQLPLLPLLLQVVTMMMPSTSAIVDPSAGGSSGESFSTLGTLLAPWLSCFLRAAADAGAATPYLPPPPAQIAADDSGSWSSSSYHSLLAQSHDVQQRAENPDWNSTPGLQLLLPLLMQMRGNDVTLAAARDIMMMSNRAAHVTSSDSSSPSRREEEDRPMWWQLLGPKPPPPCPPVPEHAGREAAQQDKNFAIVSHQISDWASGSSDTTTSAGLPLTVAGASNRSPPAVVAAASSTTPYLLHAQNSTAVEGGMTYVQDSRGGADWNLTGIQVPAFLPLLSWLQQAGGGCPTTWTPVSSSNTPAYESTAIGDNTSIRNDSIDSNDASPCVSSMLQLKTEQRYCGPAPKQGRGASSQTKKHAATLGVSSNGPPAPASYTGYKQHRSGKISLVKPAKRLSAYNIFFSEERLRILAQLNRDKDDDDPASSCVSTAIQQPDMTNNLVALQEHRRKKRKRKPHHTIGFQELGMLISARWRNVTAAERTMYQQKADQDRVRFSMEQEVYRQTQQAELTRRQRELEESVDQGTKNKYFAD